MNRFWSLVWWHILIISITISSLIIYKLKSPLYHSQDEKLNIKKNIHLNAWLLNPFFFSRLNKKYSDAAIFLSYFNWNLFEFLGNLWTKEFRNKMHNCSDFLRYIWISTPIAIRLLLKFALSALYYTNLQSFTIQWCLYLEGGRVFLS